MTLRSSIVLLGALFCFSCSVSSQSKDSLSIRYIAHASFLVSSGNTTLLIDPFKSKQWIGYNFPGDIRADAALITHPHYDHDGGRFLGAVPYWATTMEVFEEPGAFEIGNFRVRGISGKHCDPYGKEFGQNNTIFTLEAAGLQIVHLGDNGPLTEENYAALEGTDILMIPIDSHYHILSHADIQTIINRLRPKLIIPMHYRIPHLEEVDKPKTLGDIDPYLAEQQHVIRLKSNRYTLTKKELPETPTYMKFKTRPHLHNH